MLSELHHTASFSKDEHSGATIAGQYSNVKYKDEKVQLSKRDHYRG